MGGKPECVGLNARAFDVLAFGIWFGDWERDASVCGAGDKALDISHVQFVESSTVCIDPIRGRALTLGQVGANLVLAL